VYEGEWKADLRHGRGTGRFANGDVYEGEFKADMRHGRGTYRFAGGEVEVGRYEENNDVGEAAKWSADGQRACRFQDGEPVEEISLEEARAIAARVGVPAPF